MQNLVHILIAAAISGTISNLLLHSLNNKTRIFTSLQQELGNLSASNKRIIKSGGSCLAILIAIFLGTILGGNRIVFGTILGILLSLSYMLFE